MRTPTGIEPLRKLRVYLRCVRRNIPPRYMKKAIRVQQIEEAWSEAMEGRVPLPDEPLADEHPWILAALAKLSPQHRRILKMTHIEGLSPQEIQAALGCTGGALRDAQHRALKALREALKE